MPIITKEELREKARLRKQKQRERIAQNPELKEQKKREQAQYMKSYRESLSPEKKERYIEKHRADSKRYYDKVMKSIDIDPPKLNYNAPPAKPPRKPKPPMKPPRQPKAPMKPPRKQKQQIEEVPPIMDTYPEPKQQKNVSTPKRQKARETKPRETAKKETTKKPKFFAFASQYAKANNIGYNEAVKSSTVKKLFQQQK